MKKILLLIFLILLAFLSYRFLIPEKKDEIKKTTQKIIQQETIKIDYKNIKIEKELIETLPSNTEYEEEKYKKVNVYNNEEYKKKEEDFSINTTLSVDEDKEKIDGLKIEILQKF